MVRTFFYFGYMQHPMTLFSAHLLIIIVLGRNLENQGLTSLHVIIIVQCSFFSNKLSRDGAGHFAKLLRENPPLQQLDLSYNRIEDEGLEWLSQALVENHNLSRLEGLQVRGLRSRSEEPLKALWAVKSVLGHLHWGTEKCP